jgi:hypothetical protein
MSSPESLVSTIPTLAYRDRRSGLMAFGIVQIIFGLLAALGVPFILLAAVFSGRSGGGRMPAGGYALVLASYTLAAIILITLGVGSIQARRWARAFTLITSWMWLVGGSVTTVLLAFALPSSFLSVSRRAAETNPATAPLPEGMLAGILTFMIVFCSIFLVLLPLVFVWFYRKKDVEETVKHRSPQDWTDRCPLPVLAATLVFAWAAPYFVVMSMTTPLIPFFGRYLIGVPGAIGCLVFAAIDAYLAYSLFRLRLAGWWGAIFVMAFRTSSAIVTYARGNLMEAYARLGWKDQQLQRMKDSPLFRSHLILWWSATFLLAYLGYLIWIKRYFVARPVNPATAGADASYGEPLRHN